MVLIFAMWVLFYAFLSILDERFWGIDHGSVLMLASCAKSSDRAKVTAEDEKIMTFAALENIKVGSEIDGLGVYTRLGAKGQWWKKA